MARLCERPGCSQPAEVIFGIDADRLVVWLEGLDGNVVQRAGVLCRRHADSMVVPIGWMLDDRRTETPRLFTPRTPTPVRHRPPRRPRIAAGEPADTGTGPAVPARPAQPSLLEIDDAPVPPPAPVAVAADEADPAPGWQPKFDQDDDLGGLLTARSPLLSRAFRLESVDGPPEGPAESDRPTDVR